MGDTISNLTPRVVVSQSTAPTGSDNELKNIIWIDSSSGDTAKSYNTSTSSWETIGGKPDGDTIIKNSNGEIEVPYPFKINLLDLSSGQGDWTITEETDVSGGTATVNFYSGYVEFDANQTTGDSSPTVTASIEATKDLSDIDQITVNIPYATNSSDNQADGVLNINGTEEIRKQGIDGSQTWTIDTTSYGENATIEILISANYGGYGTFRVDNMESREKNLPLTTQYRGAGE